MRRLVLIQRRRTRAVLIVQLLVASAIVEARTCTASYNRRGLALVGLSPAVLLRTADATAAAAAASELSPPGSQTDRRARVISTQRRNLQRYLAARGWLVNRADTKAQAVHCTGP